MFNLLFAMVNTFSNLGAADWTKIDTAYQFLKPIVSAIESALWPILIVVAAAGSIYAVVLGVNMAKAADAGAREEAKKRVINVVIALVITIVLILLFQLFLSQLPNWLPEAPITNP